MELNVLYAVLYATRNASYAKYPYIILIGRGRVMARTASCSIIRAITSDYALEIALSQIRLLRNGSLGQNQNCVTIFNESRGSKTSAELTVKYVRGASNIV